MEAPTRRRPRDPGAEAWGLFFELFTRNRPRFAAIGSELDLAPMQMHALRLLAPGGQVPMSALAENMACDPSNVTGIVDRLEGRGLIERRGAEHDRRVKMLALTPEGARVREHIISRMAVPPPEIARLPRADQRALRDLLRRALSGEK